MAWCTGMCHGPGMSYGYRRWWHGLEWPLGAATVALVVGVVMLLIVLFSASGVQWTGISVHGRTQAGVVTYTYQHNEYQLSDDAHRSDAAAHPVTVWLSRSHPDDVSKAFLANAIARWTDFGMVVVWFLIAAGFVIGGVVRHRRFL